MTLTEFLLARITEDESNDTTLIGVARKDWSARWAAECEAKRRIVQDVQAGWFDSDLERALQNLALPYADHPDYRQEWKP